jgi:hypothetical protein
MKRIITFLSAAVLLAFAGVALAQNPSPPGVQLLDLGVDTNSFTAYIQPTDIYQLDSSISPGIANNSSAFTAGFNYYNDQPQSGSGANGGTFMTGPNQTVMTAVALKSGFGAGGSQTVNGYVFSGTNDYFRLRIYSLNTNWPATNSLFVPGNSVTGTMVGRFDTRSNANGTGVYIFTSGDWYQVTNTPVLLRSNSYYAYTIQRGQSGWDALACATNWPDDPSNSIVGYYGTTNVLSGPIGAPFTVGGEICQITTSGSSDAPGRIRQVNFGNRTNAVPAFWISTVPYTGKPVIGMPFFVSTNTTYSTLTVTVANGGTASEAPYTNQWITDGGGGGAMTNILQTLNSNAVTWADFLSNGAPYYNYATNATVITNQITNQIVTNIGPPETYITNFFTNFFTNVFATNLVAVTDPSLTNWYQPYKASEYNTKFALIVSNSSGASTSATVYATAVVPVAPNVSNNITPSNVLMYVKGGVTYSARFYGTPPMTNTWQTNYDGTWSNVVNQTSISASATPGTISATITNLPMPASGSFLVRCISRNAFGAITNGDDVATPSAILTMLADPPAPTPGVSKYADYVLSKNAWAYWRLSETTRNPALYVGTNTPAYDYGQFGNFSGLVGSNLLTGASAPSIAGPQPADGSPPTNYQAFETNNVAASFLNSLSASNGNVSVTPLNLNRSNVTITAWISPEGGTSAGLEGGNWGILVNRGAGVCGLIMGTGTNLGPGGDIGMCEVGYIWNNLATTYNFHSGLYPRKGQWNFVAVTVTPTNASLYLCYVDYLNVDPNTFTPTIVALKAINNVTNAAVGWTNGTTLIGGDSNGGRNFDGRIDEVAVFTNDFTDTDVLKFFTIGLQGTSFGVAPAVTAPTPAVVTNWAGERRTFSVQAFGSTNLGYYWQSAPVGSASFTTLTEGSPNYGTKTTKLTVDPVTVARDYRFIAANGAGAATSGVAEVSLVLASPGAHPGNWVMNFQLTNGNNGTVGSSFPWPWATRGVLWDGSTSTNRNYWNIIGQVPIGSVVSNLTDFAQDGVTHLGVSAVAQLPSGWSSGYNANGAHELWMLDMCAQILGTNSLWGTDPPQQGTNMAGPGYEDNVKFYLPNGTYNLAAYASVGTYCDRATEAWVNGQRQATTQAQDTVYAYLDNTMTWTNLAVTNGTLTAYFFSVPWGNRNAQTNGSTEGDLNGWQLQQVSVAPYYPTAQLTNTIIGGTNLSMSWDATWGARLYAATNLATNAVWVPVAATSPFVIPITNVPPQRFFRVRTP